MTKAELVEEVARAAELNKRDAEVIVETVFDSIIGALHKGEKVELRGFGSFRTRERGPRRGRNPKTGEPVDVPAKRVPYFKPGKELKDFFTDSPDDGASSAGESQGAAGSPSADYQAGAPAGGENREAAGAGEGPDGQSAPAPNERSFGASSSADDATGAENSAGDRAGDEESAGGSNDGEGSPSGPGH